MHIIIQNNLLQLYDDNALITSYSCSLAKNGFGNVPGSNKTPTGKHRICKKYGGKKTWCRVFVAREPTKEVQKIFTEKAPVVSKVITRILWLEGLEPANKTTKDRYIYIHGTANEWAIGQNITNGCITLKNKDVVDLFDRVEIGTVVNIICPKQL